MKWNIITETPPTRYQFSPWLKQCQWLQNRLNQAQLAFSQTHPGGGGPLVFQGGYYQRKKNHVIRVIFQDQTMYASTSFRVSKTCKIEKKGMKILHKYVFRVCYKNLLKSYVTHVFLMIKIRQH